MSVLRRAKLRTPDGIESIEYPLGVDAENVEVANRENLSQRLVRIDEDLEKNEEDIAAVNEIAGVNRQNIGAAEVRIDALERRNTSVNKKPYYFNTVADMKAYQRLVEGDMAITLGYYTANDGGGAEYYITNVEIQTKHQEDLNNSLYATLIINDVINIKQLGAYGDNEHDDTLIINQILDKFDNHTIFFPNGTYLVSDKIYINNKDISLLGDSNSIIKAINEMADMIDYRYDSSIKHNRFIKGLTFDGNALANNVLVLEGNCVRVEDILVLNPIEKGVYLTSRLLENGSIYEIFINNLTINNKIITENYNGIGLYVDTSDSSFNNIVTVNMKIGIYNNKGMNFFNNIHPWVSNTNIFNESYGIYNKGFGGIFNNCYFDTVFYGFWSDLDACLYGGHFKIVSKFYLNIVSNPVFIYAQQRSSSFGVPTISAINCYFENAENRTYNPYISNTKNTMVITPTKHPTLFYTADDINDYIPYKKEKFYKIDFGSTSIGANSYYAKEINVQGVRYNDQFSWVPYNYLPDGIIANMYLRDNKIGIRYYNTTASQITVNNIIYFTLKTNWDNSRIIPEALT